MGTPEYVVSDSLARLRKIVDLSRMGSCAATRNSEFRREITSYWSRQQGLSLQNLILLDRPQAASKLFALSDPRQALPSGQETVWLATDLSSLKSHYRRTIGRSPRMRAPETPDFTRSFRVIRTFAFQPLSCCLHGSCHTLLLTTALSC